MLLFERIGWTVDGSKSTTNYLGEILTQYFEIFFLCFARGDHVHCCYSAPGTRLYAKLLDDS